MPQMSTDCLGLLLFYARFKITHLLTPHYARNVNPVAFIDESYETDASETFYVVAVAIVKPDELGASRRALSDFYGGSALHAAPMWRNAEYESLRQATELVAGQNDGMDVVICAPIVAGESRDEARAMCLSHAAAKVHTDFGTSLFVIDSLSTPTERELDQRTFSDLRKAGDGRLPRDSVAVHVRPSEEILLGLPDILAWSYRQEHTRGDGAWFEPMREFTEVTVLNGR